MNNKGLSLIELVVALAISSLIITMLSALILNSMKSYNKQSLNADLQNESQVILNSLADSIMESTIIDLESNANKLLLYTGERDVNGLFTTSTGKCISWENGTTLYRFDEDKSNMQPADMPGYIMSEYVKSITVTVDESCRKEKVEVDLAGNETTVVYYTNPIVLDIKLDIEKFKEKTTTTQKVRLRNTLTSIKINGTTYEVRPSYEPIG